MNLYNFAVMLLVLTANVTCKLMRNKKPNKLIM